MKHRELVLLVAVLAALGLTFGTSSVSSVSADRGIEVTVTNDQQAFLAFEQRATTTNGTTSLNMTVGNQYPAGTPLSDVTVSVNNTTVDLTTTQNLAVGEQRTSTLESVSCSDTITVEAAGFGVSTTLERPVSCP